MASIVKRCVLLVAAFLLAGIACRDEPVELQATIDTSVATERVQQVIAYVEDPKPQIRVHTSSLNVIQSLLIDGNSNVTHDGPDVPGLLAAEEALSGEDDREFCEVTGAIIRGSFVNRLMSPEALDAVHLSEDDINEHDAQGQFTGDEGEIRLMGYGVFLGRDSLGIKGDVVSELWKETTLELMDVIYGLGQECVDAAKET